MKRRDTGNIKVGKPDVDPKLPSHVRGVHQGNDPKRLKGDEPPPSSRSTGINPHDRQPIDPRMPRLPPA